MATEYFQIGKAIADGTIGERDALHVPVVLTTGGFSLERGQFVRFTDSRALAVKPCDGSDAHAIVDPFIDFVNPGEKFWVLMLPGTVTKLTHSFRLNLE